MSKGEGIAVFVAIWFFGNIFGGYAATKWGLVGPQYTGHRLGVEAVFALFALAVFIIGYRLQRRRRRQ